MALENNQIRSVNLMIDYIVKYQNSFVYAHLFEYNLVELLQKQVALTALFSSKVLTHTFDFDEWPATHPNRDSMKGAYNYSIFALRYQYGNVFNELYQKDTQREAENFRSGQRQKEFKIKYHCNTITSMSEKNG